MLSWLLAGKSQACNRQGRPRGTHKSTRDSEHSGLRKPDCRGGSAIEDLHCPIICVCLKMLCTPLYPWFCWSLSLLNGYFIGNIYTIFSDKPIWKASLLRHALVQCCTLAICPLRPCQHHRHHGQSAWAEHGQSHLGPALSFLLWCALNLQGRPCAWSLQINLVSLWSCFFGSAASKNIYIYNIIYIIYNIYIYIFVIMFFSPSHNRINRLPLPIGSGLTLAFYGGSELEWDGISCSRRVALFFFLAVVTARVKSAFQDFHHFSILGLPIAPQLERFFCCFSSPETREDTRPDIAPRPEISTEASIKVGMSVDEGIPNLSDAAVHKRVYVRSMSVEWVTISPSKNGAIVAMVFARAKQKRSEDGQDMSGQTKLRSWFCTFQTHADQRKVKKWRPLHEGQKRRTFQINWISAGCWWLLMAVDGCWWLLMAVDGCWWLLMAVASPFWNLSGFQCTHSFSLAQFTGRWRWWTDFWGEDRWSKFWVRWT